MINDRYIIDGYKVRAEPDYKKWLEWYSVADRAVGKTDVGDAQISTVFLSFDHSYEWGSAPILFETMVFGGELDGETVRYETREQAERGHVIMVERVKALGGIGGRS